MGIRIVVADDHRLMREGLAALLARDREFQLVGQAEDGLAAVKQVRELQPDVLLTDATMPSLNGIEAIRRVRQEHPEVKSLCLSMHNDSRMVMGMIDAGASGYVLKDCCFEELGQAIRKVMSGHIYLSPDLVDVVVHEARRRQGPALAGMGNLRPRLTLREREIVQLISEGHSTSQIAERLHVSAKTVATHRENALHKLDMHSIAELTRYAIREGFSSLDTAPEPRTPRTTAACAKR